MLGIIPLKKNHEVFDFFLKDSYLPTKLLNDSVS